MEQTGTQTAPLSPCSCGTAWYECVRPPPGESCHAGAQNPRGLRRRSRIPGPLRRSPGFPLAEEKHCCCSQQTSRGPGWTHGYIPGQRPAASSAACGAAWSLRRPVCPGGLLEVNKHLFKCMVVYWTICIKQTCIWELLLQSMSITVASFLLHYCLRQWFPTLYGLGPHFDITNSCTISSGFDPCPFYSQRCP